MGFKTRFRTQPDQAYDPRITELGVRPFNAPGSGTGPGSSGGIITGTDALGAPIIQRTGQWVNRNVSNTTPILLPALMTSSVRQLPANPLRTGLLIQNKDAANTITVSFGNDTQGLGLNIAPGVTMLLDFTTPGDSVYLFNGNATTVQAVVTEIVRAASGS
jgi:hypothetical protein